jgi:hypothetical protein
VPITERRISSSAARAWLNARIARFFNRIFEREVEMKTLKPAPLDHSRNSYKALASRTATTGIVILIGSVVACSGASSEPVAASDQALTAESSVVAEAQSSTAMEDHLNLLSALGWSVPSWSTATVAHATAEQLAATNATADTPTTAVQLSATLDSGGQHYRVDVVYIGDGKAVFRSADKASATRLHSDLNSADLYKMAPSSASGEGAPPAETQSADGICVGPEWASWYVYYTGAAWACWEPGTNDFGSFFDTWYGAGYAQGWASSWDGCAVVRPGCIEWQIAWGDCGFISDTCSGYPVSYSD